MEAKELMLNDLVFVTGDFIKEDGTTVYEKRVCPVINLIDKHIHVKGMLTKQPIVEPVPLVETTLKANNFVLVNGDWCYGMFYFSIRKDGSYYMNIAGMKITIQFVHELQQVLRRCGLNELADNFKLKEK